MAYDKEDRIVGGTINLIKNTHFYGRYWGSFKFVKNLHFEACYYKAIEYCILHGITYMEPGAGNIIPYYGIMCVFITNSVILSFAFSLLILINLFVFSFLRYYCYYLLSFISFHFTYSLIHQFI